MSGHVCDQSLGSDKRLSIPTDIQQNTVTDALLPCGSREPRASSDRALYIGGCGQRRLRLPGHLSKLLDIVGSNMSEIALLTWVVTVLGGLFLLAIWLIEYDPDIQRAAATRLPVPVISGHATLAICGLATWVTYLITNNDRFAWATLAILAAVVSLGLTMATRWVVVYRTTAKPARGRVAAAAVA